MAQKRNVLLNKKGQSTVEYILLFLVVSLFATTVLNHPRFKEFFGQDSDFFARLGTMIEYSYRHGKPGFSPGDTSDYQRFHESYYNTQGGHTHFFIGDQPYGRTQ